MDGILKVDPQALRSASSEFLATAGQVQTLTGEMMSLVDSMNASWQGEASRTYSSQFHKLQDDMDLMFKMITEHSTDLADMATAYETAENANIDFGGALPGDVIS